MPSSTLLATDPELELTTRMDLNHARRRGRAFEVSSVGIRRDGVFAGIQAPPATSPSGSASSASCASREERYRFLVENSPDIVFSTDAEGVFTFVSETIEQMTGFSPASWSAATSRGSSTPASLPAALERWDPLVAEPERTQVVATCS